MPTAPAQVSLPGFDRLYGLELLELAERRARGSVRVREELNDADGTVHAGVYAAIAESLAAAATAAGVSAEGRRAKPLSLQTSFLAPVSAASITATAELRHRGRTTWVWEVELSDDRGVLCALSRVTIAVTDGSSAA